MATSFTRRDFLKLAGIGVVSAAARSQASRLTCYIGTYTRGNSEGIYRCKLDAATGVLEVQDVTKGIVNPSFLAIDGARRALYAASETGEYEGRQSGSVHAFAIDGRSGALQFLNAQPSEGGAPCHLVVDRGNRYVLVANYSGGNAAVLPIGRQGRLEASSHVVQHHGSSVNESRQRGPHAHSINLDAANRHAFVADLGIDRVMVYRFDNRRGRLLPAVEPWTAVHPGAGPRHFAFHPDGRTAYVINELDSTITTFGYDAASGRLTTRQTVSTLPGDFDGQNSCADIHVSPSGRFLYGSNRGHDSIVVYAVAPDTGLLTLVQHQATGGRTPRNFAIDPTGRFLLAANQNSDTITIFARSHETGKLTPTGNSAEVPVPVCVRFMPAPG